MARDDDDDNDDDDDDTSAMEPTGRREPAEAGVATQTPSARAVRSMHPEVARSRSRLAAGDNLDLIYHGPMANKVHPLLDDRRSPMPRPERQKSGWIGKRGRDRERDETGGPATRSTSLEDALTILNYRTLVNPLAHFALCFLLSLSLSHLF